MKKLGTVLAMAVTAMTLLVGCGAPANLEEAVANDKEAKEQIDSMASESGVAIDIKENTLTYTYDLGMELDDEQKEAVVEQLDASIASNDSVFVDIAKSLEDETGVSGVQVVVTYTDSNGNAIYSATYNSTERVAE
ncbi:MAG: DUF4854 domain-containing protein [Lachnospiraceae bacterium]|nr:DUF4854 domain-containing protein [Lachnospiraceae bacterium]